MKPTRMSTGRTILLAAAAALFVAPAAAPAQRFSDSYNFLKAVKDRDGTEATKLIEQPGTTIIDARDRESGETALHIVVKRRDNAWLSFLLGKGARPDIKDNDGNTPLMAAAQLRYVDGAQLLIARKARVNLANNSGETPLIRAVQLGDTNMVRVLVEAGADPNQRDLLAGMSAREYAQRDQRLTSILRELDAAKPQANKPMQGPKF
ncbi:ankyrin repeat domain-containing protein [Sphingomonas sanxanigenens]|uniref:Uncharacterized protein n=1 Tax=Sphingomonas sanxanigenens DSM 19645 = NX02 TaxID=1123269 RepID=W0AJG8_9SPHN|nr:ankyrin repeat domain-containing protein [Sphingomonas sanxanigenens]AHE56702.1 hypothetical protein NX02_25480 [Sphingomonas sanxanigenens DSM 19645 = NX02]